MTGKTGVTLRLGAEGDEKVLAALRKIGQAGDEAFADLSREAKEAARSFDRLEKSVDASARSAAQVARAYVQANNAVAAGVRTHEDAQRVVDLAAQRHRQLTGAVNDNSKAAGLARHEWINLSRQFQDIGVSLAGGQSPLTVLFQQGSQVADIFGSSQAGASGALRSFGATAARVLLGPVGAIAALTGGLVAMKIAGDAAAASLAKLGEESLLTGLSPNRVAGAKIVGARAGLDEKASVGAFENASKEFQAFSRNSGAVKDTLEKVDKGFLSVADRARNASEWIDRIVQKIRELPREQGLNLSKALFGEDAGRKLFDEIQRGAVSMASLSREAEKAGANFDASAVHAEKMKREIAEIDQIASTRLLATFGDLANPVLAMEKAWANMKLGIVDVERSARQLRDTLRFKSGELLGEQGEAASSVFARMRGQRAFGGKDPFAGKSLSDVDPLVNLFTQSDKSSRPQPVGDTRKLFEPAAKKTGKSAAEKAGEKFTDIQADLRNKISLASVAAEGAEHDKIALKIKIVNEQRRIGVGATQQQKDEVAGLVTKLDAAEKAQKSLTKEAELYRDAMKEVGDVTKSFLHDLERGDSLGKALGNTLRNIQGKTIDKGVDAGIGALGGLLKGGLSAFGLGGGTASPGTFSSPLFSGSPFTFGFADGGVMTSRGPLPLRRYAAGGVADTPQLAMFGEGRTPEAYVPLPDGRSIPVAMRGNEQKVIIQNFAPGIDIQQQVTPQGVVLTVQSMLKDYSKQIPGLLADAQRRGNR